MTERLREIVTAYHEAGSLTKAAERCGISKQRVWQAVHDYKCWEQPDRHDNCPVDYKDTGCVDEMYPSCLNCPLPKCREE